MFACVLNCITHSVKILVTITSCICSVAQSHPILCDPMDCSMPGFPVHHQLLEPTQTHVHHVGDAIQPSHPLSSPSPPAFNISHPQVFSNENALRIRWPKYWSFSFSISHSNEHSGLISFRMDWLDLPAVPCAFLCPGITLVFSSVQFSHSIVSDSLQPSGLQHARLPCPSPTPGAYSNSCT